jgi:hypothetical protein
VRPLIVVTSRVLVSVTGFRTESVARDGDQLVLVAEDGRRLDPVDEVIASPSPRSSPS